jgi:hypothetical protein
MPSGMDGTELSVDELCGSLTLHYGRSPTRLQPTCDGCGAAFTA